MTYQTLTADEKEAFHEWLATDLLGWELHDLDNACGDPDCCTPWPHVVWCKEITDETGAKIWVQVDHYLTDEWQPDTDRNHLAFVLNRVEELQLSYEFIEGMRNLGINGPFESMTASPKEILSALYTIKTEIEEALSQ